MLFVQPPGAIFTSSHRQIVHQHSPSVLCWNMPRQLLNATRERHSEPTSLETLSSRVLCAVETVALWATGRSSMSSSWPIMMLMKMRDREFSISHLVERLYWWVV